MDLMITQLLHFCCYARTTIRFFFYFVVQKFYGASKIMCSLIIRKMKLSKYANKKEACTKTSTAWIVSWADAKQGQKLNKFMTLNQRETKRRRPLQNSYEIYLGQCVPFQKSTKF